MKTILIGIISGALALSAVMAMAQSGATPATSASASEPQTSATQTAQASPQAPQTQSPRAAAAKEPASPVTRIAPGSVIPVSLTKTIDAKKAKTGDAVEAKVTQDMKDTNGEVIVAKDTKMIGRVTEEQARNKEQKESQIGIEFDRAVMKNGTEMQMPMSIQAIIGQQNNNAQNAQGNDSGSSAPTGGGSSSPVASGGRPGMGGGSSPAPPTATGSSATPSNTQAGTGARPPITAKTEGVVGISNLSLTATGPNSAQGSLVSSAKSNVKLESGTMMLLRVNQ